MRHAALGRSRAPTKRRTQSTSEPQHAPKSKAMRQAGVGRLLALLALVLVETSGFFAPPSGSTRRPGPTSTARARARAARRWVTQARAGAAGNEPTAPPVVAVIGRPGSGQTTFASQLAEECGARLMGVAEKGILEELRARLLDGKGKVAMPQALTEAVAGRVARACAEGKATALVLDGWPRGPYQLERLQAAGGHLDRAVFLDTGEESEDAQLAALREALGPAGASTVVNDGSVDEVYAQVLSALGPALRQQQPPPSPSRAPASSTPAAAEATAFAPEGKKAEEEEEGPLMFGGLMLTGSLARALRRAGIRHPTEVQEVALPKIKRGADVLIHEETGSGKTLAYLLPLLQDLDTSVPRQVMIVTPTRELAVQVGRVANELLASGPSGSKKADVALLIEESGNSTSSPLDSLSAVAAPVLVGTAKVIWAEMQKCNGTAAASRGDRRAQEREGNDKGSKALSAALKNLKALVIDEIDRCVAPLSVYATLKEKRQKARHPKPATLILEEVYQRQQGIAPQFVGASATIGRPLRRELARCIGVDPKFAGPAVLRADRAAAKVEAGGRPVGIPEGIRHKYIAVPGDDMQPKLMAARAYLLERQPRQPLIFVPSDTPVSEVVGRMNRLLRNTGLEVMALHEAMGFTHNRDGLVRRGGRPKKGAPEEEEEGERRQRTDLLTMEDAIARSLASTTAGDERSDQPSPILVTSVETARGLDFGGACDCVLILGRVKTPDDYQHVAGRTGRRRTIALGTGSPAAATGAPVEEGVAVSIIGREDVRKLGAYESMLDIRFEWEREVFCIDDDDY